ncbi:MAG: hypothetical protein KAX78_08185, partial [Phycisphaerae bacterium]|nr:hypothetical protein [Phycisphaerae bacterium]
MKTRRRSSRRAIELLFILLVICGLAAGYAAAENWDISEVDGDGIDNDGDGYTDSDDTECGSYYEGYGTISVGGAGGTVFWVDPAIGDVSPGLDPHSGTHADPCGLRKALDGPNRVVKFISGGTITLQDSIIIRDSFVTIDGFSAPGPGVTITQTHQTHGGIYFSPYDGEHAHDYIVSHLRLDGLWDEDPTHAVGWWLLLVDGDCFISGGATLGSKVSKMILDHLAIRDVQDKTTLWKCVEDVTISNCLFYNSGMALLFAGREGLYERKNLSVHHNVLAENNERNPQLRDWITNLDFVNNVIYHWAYSDWGYGCRVRNMDGEDHVDANIVNNYFYTPGGRRSNALIYGMDPGRDSYDNGPAIPLPQGSVYTESDMGELWVAGNILPPENQDQYSTIFAPLPIPAWAQVPTTEATELYQFVPQVGMQYKDTRELGVINRVMAAIGPDVYGRYVFYNDSAFDGNDPAA